jgi:hypothetical protein
MEVFQLTLATLRQKTKKADEFRTRASSFQLMGQKNSHKGPIFATYAYVPPLNYYHQKSQYGAAATMCFPCPC